MMFRPKALSLFLTVFFVLLPSATLNTSITSSPKAQALGFPGWELLPNEPGTIICRTPGSMDWTVESGSNERPASGKALLAEEHFINKLSLRFPGGGEDGWGQPLAYELREAAVPGRTAREIVFPSMDVAAVRVYRRLYVASDGIARWLDVFANTGSGRVSFQAILESMVPVEREDASLRVISASDSTFPPVQAADGRERHRGSFQADDFIETRAASGCPVRRLKNAFEIDLEPGEETGLLTFAFPSGRAEKAHHLDRDLAGGLKERIAWLSPREMASVRNFDLAAAASNAPTIRLNSPVNEEWDTGFCYGVAPVQVEAWDDVNVVYMELSYWEDWDLPQGHYYYKHPLATDSTIAPHLIYTICWDIPNSPRHSGGFWELEGTAWDAEGQSGTFKTGPFTVWGTCSEVCQPSVVIVQTPTISILQPADGQTVSGVVPVQISAWAGVGIAEVNLFIDGSAAATWSPSASPTQYAGSHNWDTTGLAHLSSHTLLAQVRDITDQTTSAQVSVIVSNPTTVSIIQPVEGQLVWGINQVQIEASSVPGILEAKLFIDDVQVSSWTPAAATAFSGTYDWNTLGLAFHSAHTLRAQVRDQLNAIINATTHVTATCVQATLIGTLISGPAFRSAVLALYVLNPDALPVDHYLLYKKTAAGDFQAWRTLSPAAFSGGFCILGDGPLPKEATPSYRLDAIAANGQVIGRSGVLTILPRVPSIW